MQAKYKGAVVGWILGFIVATIIFFNSLNQVKTELLELLNSTTLTAIATTFYALLTYILVSETRKMRKAQTEPEISITIQPSEESINYIDIVIENIGMGSARNIRFEVISDFEGEEGMFVSNIGYIKNGLDYFAPKQKLAFYITKMFENYEEKITKCLEIKVIYYDKTNKKYDPTFKINFSQLEGLIKTEKPPIYRIADNIKEIADNIKEIKDKR
jgi:hypothetical protein